MTGSYDRKLISEDGREFYGYSFGAVKDAVCEIVFNTSMSGYQEILSDPSYTDQAVVMTYPLIGNYGMIPGDDESARPAVGALIVREYEDGTWHYGSKRSLGNVMKRYHIPGIYGADTRELTRSIRDLGSRKVLLTDAATPLKTGLDILRKTDIPRDAVSRMSCSRAYTAGNSKGDETLEKGREGCGLSVVLIDCGMKRSILTSLISRGCRVNVVPWNTSPEAIAALKPDGILISNGPGDPRDVPETVENIKKLKGSFPIFGICLGHQIVSLACGADIYKLKFGHRGGNHPVCEMASGKIGMTSQNHSYAVDEASLEGTELKVTHKNLLDHTVEGVRSERNRIISVQFHPEGAPGPGDFSELFDRFIAMMKQQA